MNCEQGWTIAVTKDLPVIKAVSVAVLVDGRFLLVERSRPPSKGMFAFPGGRVETGEMLIEAARRELFEETGLVAGDMAEFRTYHLPADGCSYELTVFLAAKVTGSLQAADDAASAGFFTRAEIALLPMSSSMREAVDEILAAGTTFAKH
jgi:8-oxo-dGTP diphosphatase